MVLTPLDWTVQKRFFRLLGTKILYFKLSLVQIFGHHLEMAAVCWKRLHRLASGLKNPISPHRG
jgi:hypothetical protein